MATCPHCREVYFGNPDLCPKCYYDFAQKVVRKPQATIEQEQAKKQHALEQAKRYNDERALAMLHNAHKYLKRLSLL